MIIGRVIKQPGEVAPLSWDFAAELVSPAVIQSAVITATRLNDGTSAAAMLSGAAVTASPIVTQKITGGLAGDIVGVQCRATTDSSLVYEHEIEVHVVEE